jgi:hypothetical protein
MTPREAFDSPFLGTAIYMVVDLPYYDQVQGMALLLHAYKEATNCSIKQAYATFQFHPIPGKPEKYLFCSVFFLVISFC